MSVDELLDHDADSLGVMIDSSPAKAPRAGSHSVSPRSPRGAGEDKEQPAVVLTMTGRATW